MAIENGTQTKLIIPEHLYSRLAHDARMAGIPLASMVRLLIARHYELLSDQAQLSPADEMKQNGAPELIKEVA